MSQFVAAWPIEDLDRTQAQLVAEAERDVPDLLVEAGVVLTGDPVWVVTEAWKVGEVAILGSPHDALVLAMRAPAEPWTPPPPRRGRPPRDF